MNVHELSFQNDIQGLSWLHRFGWLRTHELGPLLWPSNTAARHRADRLARSWRERGLVIERTLPMRAGRALVLAAGGVRFLGAAGVEASSGKDVGETHRGLWVPPLTWRHDLLAAGVLVDLHLKGFEVLPETHIRRHAGKSLKLPDGLAVKGPQVIYLEVEMARKSGASMRTLADALCAVGEGTVAPLLGLRPTQSVVAFAAGQQDERGHALSHRLRVSTAVAATARRSVPITWASCSLRGAGVESVTYTDGVVEGDRAAAVMRRLEAAGWHAETGALECHYGARRALVWKDDDADCWAWQVDDLPAGRVDTITQAKRRCAEVLASSAP